MPPGRPTSSAGTTDSYCHRSPRTSAGTSLTPARVRSARATPTRPARVTPPGLRQTGAPRGPLARPIPAGLSGSSPTGPRPGRPPGPVAAATVRATPRGAACRPPATGRPPTPTPKAPTGATRHHPAGVRVRGRTHHTAAPARPRPAPHRIGARRRPEALPRRMRPGHRHPGPRGHHRTARATGSPAGHRVLGRGRLALPTRVGRTICSGATPLSAATSARSAARLPDRPPSRRGASGRPATGTGMACCPATTAFP
jgi:hypothetical protein